MFCIEESLSLSLSLSLSFSLSLSLIHSLLENTGNTILDKTVRHDEKFFLFALEISNIFHYDVFHVLLLLLKTQVNRDFY